MMQVLIVYESMYGNTHEIAEAIAEGVRSVRPDARVVCRRAAEADPDAARNAGLLVVGGPTHVYGMSSRLSRRVAVRAAAGNVDTGHPVEAASAALGVRDWFHALPKARPGAHAVAFDTRAGTPMSGGAAHEIAQRLRHHGYELLAPPEGFVVEGTNGPLREGEHDRARAWGATLV